MNKYKAVIFDLDGTLADTAEGVKKSIEYTVSQMKLPSLGDREMEGLIGPPIYNSLKEKFHLSDEAAQIGTSIFRNVYKEKFLLCARLYPKVMETLAALKSQGICLGVATYKREDYAVKLLAGLGISKYFIAIKGADYENKLTKRDIIKNCMDNIGLPREEYLYIGDTIHDAKGAEACGIDFIGVTHGFGFKSKDEAINCGAIQCFDNMEELKEIVWQSQ